MAKTIAFYLWGECGKAGFGNFGDEKALGLGLLTAAPQVQWGAYQDDSQALHSATLQGDKGQIMQDETGYEEMLFHSEDSQASLPRLCPSRA